MFSLLLYTLVSLHRDCINAFSEAVHRSGLEDSAWFMGCANAGDASVLQLHSTKGGRDLDPVHCCALCLNEGYQTAALTSESCLCSSHRPHGSVFTQCFNASSSGESKGERGDGDRQSFLSLPVGSGQGMVALYRTKGPFLHRVSVFTFPHSVRAGETFVVGVRGNLAGSPHRPTGIWEMGALDLSHVTVHFMDMRSQSSRLVNVLDDGSFVVASDWIFETPGQYEISVRVSNGLSTLSSSLQLFVSPHHLLTPVPHGPLGVLSCPPFIQKDSHPVILQVSPGEGLTTGLLWCFKGNKDSEDERSCLKTACIPSYECLYSTLAAVRPAVADLKESISETQLFEYVELFTTTKHLFVLNLTLKAKCNQNQENSTNLNSRMDGNAGMKNNLHTENSPDIDSSDNRDSKTYSVSGYCSSIYLHSSNRSGRHLHLHLSCLLHTSADNCHLSAPVSSTTAPFSLVDGMAVNETTDEWDINLSSPKVGCLQTHILVHDPAGAGLSCSTRAESEATVSMLVNATSLYTTSSYGRGDEAVVVLLFNHTGTVAVARRAENRVYMQNKSVRVCIEENRKQPPQVKVNPNWQPPTSVFLCLTDTAVRIYAAKQVYPTNADITLVAVADVQDPVEFIWHFGDSKSARTTSRTITKRYTKPGRYDVVVVMSTSQTSITSDVFLLEIQRAVRLNRLVHQASVLQNHTVTVSCRVSVGTNLTFLWSFGDGSSRLGHSTEHHVFHRTGEFRISVSVSNLISSASLSSHIFVVDRPCQPPPVKNMGPLQLQVWRSEVVGLGVTYENEVDCDVTGGLRYTWTLVDSTGRILPLPSIDTHRQSLMLPAQLLHYGVYVATARVQVVGSVVYSNYSVRVKVMPSPPVAFIQGGTNLFINSRSTMLVTLDGQRSHDPDFPLKPLSYSWTCKPVSSIAGSCFSQRVPTSSPVLTFPVAFLKHDFDQFRFTLTVHSRERESSASSDVFLTITPNVLGKVLFYCPECKGDQVNWDQTFSVSAWCEDCGVPPDLIQYTWSLYVVNASSRPVTEVPFCDTVDLKAPSAVFEGPATSPQIPSAADAVNYALDSTPVLLREELLYRPLEESDPSKSTEYPPLPLDSSDVLYLEHLSNVSSEFPNELASSDDWGFSFPVLEAGDAGGRLDYDVPLASAEEGDPGLSAGRPTGVAGESFSLGEESEVHEDEGSHLVDSRPPVVVQEQTLLDLPRDLVDVRVFESYTYTGTSSSLLSFRPFSLRPGSRYMLEVTAESRNSFLGRTQLFLKTRPAPKGVMCQVQPLRGMELHTHFSIFCASGKEDLVYEYSFSVGGRSPRTLYQGRDFQYYFRLPSGDPSDDYKVTIYTEIRSAHGTATEPCPVTVQVQPSFLRESSSPHHDPALELSESGLRNLSALVRLGNNMEIRNYASLLSSILNRLSLDAEANTHTQTHIRSALIRTLCEIESFDQQSMEDNICVLKDVVKVLNQVSYVSARRVVVHVQSISDRFLESSAPVQYNLDYKTLNSLITLLSYSLQAAINSQYTALETPQGVVTTQALDSNLRRGTTLAAPYAFVAEIHQAASDLMLKYIILHEAREHRVSTGSITLYATYQNSTVVRSGATTFYMPVSLIEQLFNRVSGESKNQQPPPCLLSVLTEFTQSPYTWAPDPPKLSGPVVSLNLYKCGTRRRIHIRSLIQPINVELQNPQRNVSSVHEYVLHHNRINYHSFNITQDHLQQAVQFSVVFKLQPDKVFPVMLLFRMFDRPTPSMHHLQSNTARITLPPSYLSAAGMGHLALLNAGTAPKHRHLRKQVSYRLTVDSSLCLSWDDQRGSWTHRGCRTKQADTAPAVGCSCHQLQPLTVVQHHLEGSHDTADLDPFISESGDLTVPAVLLLFVCLYILGLVLCKKADVISEQSQQVHPLPDNSPSDPYLYAVTIHTGLSSAACMSAKVFIVLYGEDGCSQTREVQVPGCTLFRRNSRDTFVLSAAYSLGPVWGLHIWHDNSGPSPNWYLSRVEVSEVRRERGKGRSWLFVGQCWLAVSKGDGQVEKMLHVCSQGMGFAQMLRLKLSDYLADFHIWISVFNYPCPNPFTHTQRITVCLLLLLGYSCVNTVIISQMDDQLPFELGMVDVSAVSVTTGVLSVLAVLPMATVVSFLFRCREVKRTGSGVKHATGRKTEKEYFEVSNIVPESHPSWTGVEQQQSTRILENKESAFQADVVLRKPDALTSGVSMGPVLQKKESREIKLWNCAREKAFTGHSIINKLRKTSQWCHCLAWALCLLLSLSCLVLSAVLGMRFSSSKVLLWIHSLFFSTMSCIFFIQPIIILTVAVMVSLWYRKTPDFRFFCITELEIEALKLHSCSGAFWTKEHFSSCDFPQKERSYFEELLRARQRARYLRLARPPTPAELRKTRGRKRRETVICNNLRELSVCVSMLSLVLCITYSSSFHDHYHLNTFVRRQFIRNHDNEFMVIQKHEDWWKWMQTSFLNVLYKNVSAKTEQLYILIGEPVIWKMEASCSFQGQVSEVTDTPECLHSRSRTLSFLYSSLKISKAMSLSTCDPLDCYPAPSATVGLGQTKSEAASSLTHLRSDGWLSESTLALRVQFTLYSPAPNLFTSVTLVTERSLTGVLLPSATVQSVRVYHTPAAWDYVAMIGQLSFLLLSLLQLCRQVRIVGQQGLMGYCRSPFGWLEITLLTVTLVYYVYYVYHSVLTVESVELLQRHNYKGHVDVNFLAAWEHDVRTLRGVTLFLLTTKCVTLLRMNKTTAPSAALIGRSLSSLFWPLISGLIPLVALSCVGSLLFAQNSRVFSSIPRSLQTLLFCCLGLRPVRGLLLPGYDAIYGGVLYLCSIMMMSVVSSIVRRSRRCRGRRTQVFTVAELASCIRKTLFSKIALQQRPRWTENHMEGRTYYLEEFEGLVDELLLKLNALSNSLHHKAQCYTVVSPVQSVSSVEAQDFARIEMIDETKGEQICWELAESASLIKVRTEKRADQWTETKNSQWIQTRALCTEVVVEALVHKEPEIVASPQKKDSCEEN